MPRCTSKTKTGRRCAGAAVKGCPTCTFHTPAADPVEAPSVPTFAEISAVADVLLAEPLACDVEGRTVQMHDTQLVLELVWNWGFGGLQYSQVLLIERLRARIATLT